MVLRGQNADDNRKTFEEFCADDLLETELAIRDFKPKAWKVIENDGEIDALQAQIHLLMKELSH